MLFSKKKEDPQAVPEASPENDFSPSLSQQDSSASPYENDVKKLEEEAEQTPIVDIPKKPASAYVTVSIFCLFIAFGGFVFGWDTGTISGFVAQTDFIRRLGQKRADGTHYLSKVRTGLVVSIFNIGCAIGGVILSKLGDVYGRKPGLIIVVVIYVVGIVIQIATIDKW